MSKAEILERVRTLPRQEQLALAEQIWAEQGDDANESPEVLAEWERRAAEFKKEPNTAIPWSEIRAEVRGRFPKP
jgi:putative addiction module component (TIGR02574 family)